MKKITGRIQFFFLILPLLAFISCSKDFPVSTTPVTPAKFLWEQVDSISPIGYFAIPVAAAENNTYYYISNQYLYRCTPEGKTAIDISGNFGTSTIEVFNNNYIIIGGHAPASTNDSSISKVKILSNGILSEMSIDTVADIYPAVVFITRPGRFYYASRNTYYLVEDGIIKKFSILGINNVTEFSKIGNTIFVTAYNLGSGQSIFKLQEDSSPVLLFRSDNFLTQVYSMDNNTFKAQYSFGNSTNIEYLTESGWVNFYQGSFQYFNYAAGDAINNLYLVSNTSEGGIRFHGNIWNGTNFIEDESFPFKEERWSSLYHGNMKDGIFYIATVYDKVRIYKGRRISIPQ